MPSSVTITQLPGTGSLCWLKKMALGLLTPLHGEHTDLVHGAKAVHDGAHQPELAVRIPFEIQHRVHHVFQHAGPGERALFGHMAHQHNRHAGRLGTPREVRRALAHLRHRAGCRRELVGIDRLDRVDHGHRRLHGFDGGQNLFQLNLCQHIHLAMVQPQPARPQRHLGAAFLAGHIQSGQAGALQRIQRLQQQRGLADARVAPDQHHAPFDDAPAQHTVQLINATGGARNVGRLDRRQRHDSLRLRQACKLRAAVAVFAGPRLCHRFDQRVPRVARWALAQPTRAGAATLGAGEKGFFFGHGRYR